MSFKLWCRFDGQQAAEPDEQQGEDKAICCVAEVPRGVFAAVILAMGTDRREWALGRGHGVRTDEQLRWSAILGVLDALVLHGFDDGLDEWSDCGSQDGHVSRSR